MIDTFDAPRLRRIGLSALMQQRLGRLEPGDAQPMRITEVLRDSVLLHDGLAEQRARVLPALRMALEARADALAVGDWVLARPGTSAEWWVSERVQPVTQIARRLHDGRSKVARAVIVSNVDTALLVMGLDHDFNPRRLERYLALARLAGVGAVVVLTKADLCPDVPARLSAVQALVPPGGAALAVDATSDAPGTVLAPWLAEGQTLALLGSSGAGKSTLTNSLLGATVQLTGAVRKGDARGRHTTSSRSLHRLPGGACVIDTPGLRTLRLDGEEDGIAAMFDDIAALAGSCRFRDCAHEDEPGCAVRDGIAPDRLRNFHKLLREARRDTLSALQRREQLAVWKQRSRAAREVVRGKHGWAEGPDG